MMKGTVFICLAFAFPLEALADYQIQPLLGPAGSSYSSAYGSSTAGAVGESFVGDWNEFNGVFVPTVWQSGQTQLLPLPAGFQGRATAINGSGDAAGFIWNSDPNVAQPAVWHGDQIQTLSTLNMPGGNAYGLNDQSQVVGSINDALGAVPQSLPVLWTAGQPTILADFVGAQATAWAINNAGQVVIVAGFGDHSETWVWQGGNLTQIASLGGPGMGGQGINNLGDVVGGASTAGVSSAGFLWKNGLTLALPILSGDSSESARAVNDGDLIVGSGYNDALGIHALLWQGGQVFDLNDLLPANSGWTLYEAMGIADDGTIVGYGTFDGQLLAYELTPVAGPSVGVVPEPASGLLLLASIPLMLRRHRVNR